MGRRRQIGFHTKRNQVNSRKNQNNPRVVAGCSNEGCSRERSRSSSSDSDDLEQFCTITATARDGKWVSLLKLDIMGIQFEAVMSSGSDRSVISSRVYELIEKKSNGDVRYRLRQVVPRTRVRDNFGQEIKLLGAVLVPCTIFGDCGKKSVTKEIAFLVVEGGEIDGVVGESEFSADVWDLVNPILKKPARFPLILGENDQKRSQSESSTRSGKVLISTMVGTKEFSKEAFKQTRIPNLDGTSTVQTNVLVCEDLVFDLVHGPPSITDDYVKSMRANRRPSQTKTTSAPPDRIVTIIPMSSEKCPSMVKMKIANVPFEGVLSIGSGGTILSSRIYNRIALESKHAPHYRLEKASGIKVCDTTGNEIKLLGTLRVPCTFSSARGTNSVVEPQITFLVVDGPAVDCVFGEPEIFSCQISIILHQFLLVFNNHPSPIPIAMVGATEDPDVAFNNEQEKMKNLSTKSHVSPVRIVTITIMTFTGKFPLMLKMDIVGLPFEVVLSTGSSGTVLSAEVYNRIARKTKDPRYKLQKATNVEVRDVTGSPMKLLGILNAPCRFISARGKNSVIEMMEFLVVEKLITDGVLGMPEISSCNMGLRFQKGNSAISFRNYEPPIEIAILEIEDCFL